MFLDGCVIPAVPGARLPRCRPRGHSSLRWLSDLARDRLPGQWDCSGPGAWPVPAGSCGAKAGARLWVRPCWGTMLPNRGGRWPRKRCGSDSAALLCLWEEAQAPPSAQPPSQGPWQCVGLSGPCPAALLNQGQAQGNRGHRLSPPRLCIPHRAAPAPPASFFRVESPATTSPTPSRDLSELGTS